MITNLDTKIKNNEVEKKNVRQSNFELLRILAMIMIVLHHITVHCVRFQLVDPAVYPMGEGFNLRFFYKRLLLPQLLMSTGKIGNIIFVLISGYFLINKKIDITKQIKKIFTQFLFITPILVLCSFLYYKFFSNTFVGIINFDIFNNEYWFIGYYIGIIVIAYMFLNKFLNKLDKKEYIKVLAIMFTIISVGYLRNGFAEISANLQILFVGVFIYTLGGFIRLYEPFKNIRVFLLLIILALSVGAIFVNNYNNTLNKINLAIISDVPGITQELSLYNEHNILCLFIGISLFEIFKRIKIGELKIVNYISASTFMVYLVHDNDFIKNIWKETNWIEICNNDYKYFIQLYLYWLGGIFLAGIIVYTLYLIFSKLINTKLFKKIIFKGE